MPIDHQIISRILGKIKDLPTLPDVVAKVMKAVSNPMSTANDLNEIISVDQALTFKVLRLANSAYYGFPQEITNITQAVTILGFNTIRNLALSVSVHKMLFGGGERPLFSHREFWKHSVGTAVAAKLIARRVGYKSEENAFTAGLMHDIGKNVFDQYMRKEFIQALEMSSKQKKPLWEAEREVLGMDHGTMGSLMAEKWNLPRDLRDAIHWHNNPDEQENDEMLVSIVHAANQLCRKAQVGHGGDYGDAGLDRAVAKVLMLQGNDYEKFLEELANNMREAESFLRMTKD